MRCRRCGEKIHVWKDGEGPTVKGACNRCGTLEPPPVPDEPPVLDEDFAE